MQEPTKSELEILKILWHFGPNTVRFVNDALNNQEKQVQYTSTLKLMQIMAEKNLVTRDESQMKHIYAAAIEENKTKAHLLDRFIDTVYDGSASNLILQFLGNKNTSKKEIDEIKALLNEYDKKKKR
jgi:BlaI family transcriptional regulator, penicillinase repressor